MKESVNKAYAIAKERYAAIGVDTEKVLDQLQNFHLSMHCWQADDVKGFEVQAGAQEESSQPATIPVLRATSMSSAQTYSRQRASYRAPTV